MLLNELILHFEDSDPAMIARIKGMVERILAKAKQSGATLNQLVGVAIG